MKRWTHEEIKLLKDNYQIKPKKEMCKILSDRNWRAIQTKASLLQLINRTPEEKFWKYVNKKPNNKCWHWIGYHDKDGYGRCWVHGKFIRAHRFSWMINFGNIPDEMCICHDCDNPACVNPKHLFLGTIADNNKDRDNKSRQAKGENNGNSKLTSSQVIQIRNLKGKLLQREIAKKFNVGQTIIGYIHRNKNWKYIK